MGLLYARQIFTGKRNSNWITELNKSARAPKSILSAEQAQTIVDVDNSVWDFLLTNKQTRYVKHKPHLCRWIFTQVSLDDAGLGSHNALWRNEEQVRDCGALVRRRLEVRAVIVSIRHVLPPQRSHFTNPLWRRRYEQ